MLLGTQGAGWIGGGSGGQIAGCEAATGLEVRVDGVAGRCNSVAGSERLMPELAGRLL